MMMNIFSMFDPATSTNTSHNWISIFSWLLFVPLMFFKSNSRKSTLFSYFLNFINSNIINNLKKKNLKFVAIPLSLMMIISFMNFLSLAPFYFTPTSHISATMAMSLPLWLSMNIKNWMSYPENMFAHLVPTGTPIILCPFMVIIESISNFMRPFTLSIRLSANMIAGHVLISLLSQTLSMTILMSQYSYLTLNLLSILEMSVALIQGYVFTILITLYIDEM